MFFYILYYIFLFSYYLERTSSQDTELTRLELPTAPQSPAAVPEVKVDAPALDQVEIKVERVTPRPQDRSVSVDPLANNTWSEEYLLSASERFAKWNSEQAYMKG